MSKDELAALEQLIDLKIAAAVNGQYLSGYLAMGRLNGPYEAMAAMREIILGSGGRK